MTFDPAAELVERREDFRAGAYDRAHRDLGDMVGAQLVAGEVIAEGERAAAKHGEPADRTGLQWLGILAEESGEVATEVTRGEVPPVVADQDGYRARLRAELVQVASVASRWILAIDRGEGTER